MSDAEKIKELTSQHEALKTERQSWEADARSLAKHFLPRKVRMLETYDDTNKGGLRTDVLDGTGIRATRVAIAGMHGGMTSPVRPWFRLGLADEDLSKHDPVKVWLKDVEDRMKNLFTRSNFYGEVRKHYGEVLVPGTSFMFEHSDPRTGIRFNTLTFGEYVLDANEHGMVDTVFRVMDLTARNIVRMFGFDNCSESVKRAYNLADSRLNKFKVIHAVLPREDRDPGKLNNGNMAFGSYYWEQGMAKKFLRVSGYETFPGFGARWDVTGQDVYGQSPAMDSLGDIRMLQSVWATYLKQEHKRADPPVAVPQGMHQANTLPGGTNPVSTAAGATSMYPIYQVQPDPRGIKEIVLDVRQSIREGMYNDLFKMLQMAQTRPQMTATEVAERHEEKLLQLGPILERQHTDFFTPMIDRTFAIMLEEDMVPPWPEELDGLPLKVEFTSLLAQAQKMVATSAVDQFIGFIGQAAAAWPEALDIPNIDAIGDGYADFLGIETKMINPIETREAARQQKAQQAQAQQAAEMMQPGAQAAKTLSDTQLQQEGGQSALDALMAGLA